MWCKTGAVFVGYFYMQNNVIPTDYQAAIPGCCEFQTVEEHAQVLMLCWGLLAAMNNNEKMDCSGCEYATRKVNEVEK